MRIGVSVTNMVCAYYAVEVFAQLLVCVEVLQFAYGYITGIEISFRGCNTEDVHL